MGRVDVILGDLHLDSRMKKCILMIVIVPKLEYAEVWEENGKSNKLGTVQMAAAKRRLGY